VDTHYYSQRHGVQVLALLRTLAAMSFT
jgi:hypothetical protein